MSALTDSLTVVDHYSSFVATETRALQRDGWFDDDIIHRFTCL